MLRLFSSLMWFLFVILSACSFSNDKVKTALVPLPNEINHSPQKMTDFWDEVIQKNPYNDVYLFKRALLFFEQNKLTQALSDLQKAAEIKPDKAEYFYYQALIFSKQNEPDRAISAAEKAFSLDFKNLEIYTILGKTEFERKNYAKAQLHFEQSINLAPQDPEPLFYKAKTLLAQQDTLTGLEFLKKSIDVKSDYPPAYLAMSNIFLAYKGYTAAKTAQAVSWEALKNCPDNSDIWFQHGIIFEKLYKRDSAFICFQKAVKTDEKNWKALNKIGFYFFQDQKFELAESIFLKSLSLEPNLMATNYFLAFIAENHLKNYEKAEKYYRKASEVAPNNKVLTESYRRVYKRLEYEKYKLSPEYQLDLKRIRERKRRELDSVNQTQSQKDSVKNY